jgi:hypothetical protein
MESRPFFKARAELGAGFFALKLAEPDVGTMRPLVGVMPEGRSLKKLLVAIWL